MDKKSKMLFVLLLVLIVVSIALTYYRSFISKDFEVIKTEEGATSDVAPSGTALQSNQ